MSLDRHGVNHAPNGRDYDEEVYHCHHDDWWVTIESPVTTEEE